MGLTDDYTLAISEHFCQKQNWVSKNKIKIILSFILSHSPNFAIEKKSISHSEKLKFKSKVCSSKTALSMIN